MKPILFLTGVFLSLSTLGSQDLVLSQIDTSRLLDRQEVTLYLHFPEGPGSDFSGISTDRLELRESSDGGTTFQTVPVLSLSGQSAQEEGITFYLLIDNSGSMYLQENQRITQVKSALTTFLRSADNPKDRFALSEFNTLYTSHTPPVKDPLLVEDLLGQISKPLRENGYTELYEGLIQEMAQMDQSPGRKVLIVLSDGAYFPYARGEQKPHPVFGERSWGTDEVITALEKSGISLFAVRFGDEKDQSLERLTQAGGGRVFDASNQEELEGIYQAIRAQVQKDFRVTYRASMNPAEKRRVEVVYQGDLGPVKGQRDYFAGTLFGLPTGVSWLILLAVSLLALALWFVLSRIQFFNRSKNPTLEVLSGGAGQTVVLNPGKTVIGSGPQDAMTILGAPGLQESQATVVYDEVKNTFTLVSDAPVMVNNQKMEKNRKLEPGDVIRTGGVTLVFDEPALPGKKK